MQLYPYVSICWLVGRLIDWLVGWLVGWSVSNAFILQCFPNGYSISAPSQSHATNFAVYPALLDMILHLYKLCWAGRPFICLSTHHLVCLSVHLSVCPSGCPPVGQTWVEIKKKRLFSWERKCASQCACIQTQSNDLPCHWK